MGKPVSFAPIVAPTNFMVSTSTKEKKMIMMMMYLEVDKIPFPHILSCAVVNRRKKLRLSLNKKSKLSFFIPNHYSVDFYLKHLPLYLTVILSLDCQSNGLT